MAIKIWTGATSADWTDKSNWSPAGVPGPGDTITIPAGTPNPPTIMGGDTATIYAGTVDNEGKIALNHGHLDINGDVVLSGGGNVVLSDGSNSIGASSNGSGILDNADNTISGAGMIEGKSLAVVNEAGGVMQATGTNNALTIFEIAGFTNAGLLEGVGVGGLTIEDSTIANAGGTIEALAGSNVVIEGATIEGGDISTTGSGVIHALNGATFDGAATAITITTGSNIQTGAINLEGMIANEGAVILAGAVQINGATTLEGSGSLMLSNGANGAASISGHGAEASLDLKQSLSGSGSFRVSAGLSVTIDIGGVIDANATAALSINGFNSAADDFANDGLLEATNTTAGNGGLIFGGDVIDQTGDGNRGVIAAIGANAHVEMANVRIVGGTLKTSGGGVIQASFPGLQLDGTRAGDPLTIAAGSMVEGLIYLTASAGDDSLIDNHGTLSTGSQIEVGTAKGGTVMLEGGGSVVLTGGLLESEVSSALLDNVDNTISGGGDITFGQGLSFINGGKGVIDATSASVQLWIGGMTNFVNTGTVTSTGAAGLEIFYSTVQNAGGKIKALTGSQITLNGADIEGGTFSTAGTGAILSETATFDGSASPIVITAGTTITDIGSLTLEGRIANAGTISVGSHGLYISGSLVLSAAGRVIISSNGVVRGSSGSLLDNQQTISGMGSIDDTGSLSLLNDVKGIITANGVGELTIENIGSDGTTFVNEGILEATSTTAGITELYLFEDTIDQTQGGNRGVIAAIGANAEVVLGETRIIGGTLRTSGGGVIETHYSSELDGTVQGDPLTIAKGSLVIVSNSTNLTLMAASGANGVIVNLGTLEVGKTDGLVIGSAAGGVVTLQGGGAIALADFNSDGIAGGASGCVLDNVDNDISGAGQISGSDLTLNNLSGGIIDAIFADTALVIDPSAFTNSGTVRADNGATLEISGGLTNIAADPNHAGGDQLVGGTYAVEDVATGASAIAISGGAKAITTLAATVDLYGAAAKLTAGGTSLATSLVDVAVGGTLNLYYGAASATEGLFNDGPNPLEIGGTIGVNGSTLDAGSIHVDQGGRLMEAAYASAAAVIMVSGAAGVYDDGKISLTSATFTVAGGFDNLGVLALDAAAGSGGSNLTIDGALTNSTSGSIQIGDATLSAADLVTVEGGLISSGSINIASGAGFAATLAITGGSSTWGGAIKGTGALRLSGGETEIDAGASITVAQWSISGSGASVSLDEALTYAGAFSASAGATLVLTGGALTLKGGAAFAGVAVNGGLTLSTTGAVSVSGLQVGGTATWNNIGVTKQSGGNVTLGDASGGKALLRNSFSGTYDIIDDGGILLAPSSLSVINNAGLFEKTGGTGASIVSPAIFNTGVVLAASGKLDLAGALTGTGKAEAGASGKLEVDNAVAATQTFVYLASGGEFLLDDLDVGGSQLFHGTISGFAKGDELDVGTPFGAGTHFAFTENAGNTSGTLSLTCGKLGASITFLGDYSNASFTPIGDGNGGTLFKFHA